MFLVLAKGGPVGKKKKSKKYDDYVDLGAGYDETDPFIDNTDAVSNSLEKSILSRSFPHIFTGYYHLE